MRRLIIKGGTCRGGAWTAWGMCWRCRCWIRRALLAKKSFQKLLAHLRKPSHYPTPNEGIVPQQKHHVAKRLIGGSYGIFSISTVARWPSITLPNNKTVKCSYFSLHVSSSLENSLEESVVNSLERQTGPIKKYSRTKFRQDCRNG